MWLARRARQQRADPQAVHGAVTRAWRQNSADHTATWVTGRVSASQRDAAEDPHPWLPDHRDADSWFYYQRMWREGSAGERLSSLIPELDVDCNLDRAPGACPREEADRRRLCCSAFGVEIEVDDARP